MYINATNWYRSIACVWAITCLSVSPALAGGFALWVHDTTRAIIEAHSDEAAEAQAEELLQFCLENNITLLYLEAIDIVEPNNYARWRFVLEKFRSVGIKVEALIGDAD